MKAIIYAGIGLFSVATVYGIADYYSTQKKGTLNNLYKEQEEIPAEPEKELANNNVVPVDLKEINSTNVAALPKAIRKIKLHKRTISLDEFSRGRIIEPMPAVIVQPVEPVKAEPVKVEPKKADEASLMDAAVKELSMLPVAKKEIERKFNLDMFSRAPLKPRLTIKYKEKKEKELTLLKPDQQ